MHEVRCTNKNLTWFYVIWAWSITNFFIISLKKNKFFQCFEHRLCIFFTSTPFYLFLLTWAQLFKGRLSLPRNLA